MMMNAMNIYGGNMFIEKTPIVRQFTTFHDTLRLTALFDSREEPTASSATISGTESENTYT